MRYTGSLIRKTWGIAKPPEYLYHYTSIETLALILKHSKLRFSRLDTVNDPSEAETVDLPNASSLVFVSCWTAEKCDSIPMWRMYTPNMQGVRIELPPNPFSGRKEIYFTEDSGFWQLLDGQFDITHNNSDIGISTSLITDPNKIFYTDNPSERIITCRTTEPDKHLRLHDLGLKKSTNWEFEKEWRYKILATFSEIRENTGDEKAHLYRHPEKITLNEMYLDAPLDKDVLREMNVMLSPCCTEAQGEIVNALLKQYGHRGTCMRSSIRYRNK